MVSKKLYKLLRKKIVDLIMSDFFSDLCDDEEPYSFKVVFLGEDGREYIMHAETHEQMEGWMRSISSASYEYITLMVAEMQKKLDEITSKTVKSSG